MPRHPPCALLSLTFRCVLKTHRLQSCSNHFLLGSLWRYHHTLQFNVMVSLLFCLISCDFSQLSCFTFLIISLFSFQGAISAFQPVVGSNGLEPSTSRLSGVRSNHLSYEPISVAVLRHFSTAYLVEMNRIELSTPCLQGRCSPS